MPGGNVATVLPPNSCRSFPDMPAYPYRLKPMRCLFSLFLFIFLAQPFHKVIAEELLRIAFLPPTASPGITEQMENGIRRAAESWAREGITIQIVEGKSGARNPRVAQAESLALLAQERPDGILVAPMDCMMIAEALSYTSGIPVHIIDSLPIAGASSALHTFTLHREAGRTIAREIAKAIGGKGQVILFRHAIHDMDSEAREEGFMEVMFTEYPGIELVSTDFHAGDRERNAKRAAASLLKRAGGNPDAVFASNEAGTLAMLLLLEGKKSIIMGFSEGSPEIMKAIRDGRLAAAIVPDYQRMAESALNELVKSIRSKGKIAHVPVPLQILRPDGNLILGEPGNFPGVIFRETDWQSQNPEYRKPAFQGETERLFVIPEINMELLKVYPGTLIRTQKDEKKQIKHKALIEISKPFWMGRFEVTQAEWNAIMEKNPSMFQDPRRPVENITWEDACNFCRKLTEKESAAGRLPEGLEYRLPTEAEWEYARNAGTLYPPEDFTPDDYGYYSRNSGQYHKRAEGGRIWRMSTHPVGSKRPNAWGFYDLFGNVQEFIADWSGPLLLSDSRDPQGPEKGTHRVLRGGCWWADGHSAGADFRQAVPPTRKHSALGFRVVLGKTIENF